MRPRDLLVRLGGAALLTIAVVIAPAPTAAQKQGGTLRIYHFDSPPSMSVHEEVTVSTNVPMMGVFNNLVLYDQHVARPSLQSIVPELATSWSWSDDGKTLTFTLRGGVKWHDGQPFTARDVKCTWELLFGTAPRCGTRSRVGLCAKMPQKCAGARSEPPISEPSSNGTKPAASAAAAPPDDPPGVRERSHGLLVVPYLVIAL